MPHASIVHKDSLCHTEIMMKYITTGKLVALGSVLAACFVLAGLVYGVMHPKPAKEQSQNVVHTESPPKNKTDPLETNPFENQYRLPSSTPGG